MTLSEKEIQVKEYENPSTKNQLLVIPYQGEKGRNIVNSMKKYVNKILPENVRRILEVQIPFTGKRISSCFKTKDRTRFEHQNDIIYQVNCSGENCLDDYIGESTRRIIERVEDHGGKDTKSHVLRHSSEKEHIEDIREDFEIICSHFKNNRLKRNIAEALLIKQEHPSLNV